MKIFKTIWRGARAWFITTVVLIVFLLVASIVCTQWLLVSNTFNMLFGGERMEAVSGDPSQYEYFKRDEGFSTKAESLSTANKFNEEIVEEGIVLLKNEDDVLPLSGGAKITVFGKNSVDLVYGGSGSGSSDTSSAVTLYQALDAAGLECNPEAEAFFKNDSLSGSGRPASPGMNGTNLTFFDTGETNASSYSQALKDSLKDYNDAALVVISRIGGEGFDLPSTADFHYLELDEDEKSMLDFVCSQFDDVILIINCASPMELGFLTDPEDPDYHEELRGAVWLSYPGMTGVNALGRVLTGEVNPSGRLVDIYSRDFTADPTYRNFGFNDGSDGGNEYVYGSAGTSSGLRFVYYEEGVYVGYRYYETRYITEPEDTRDEWYEENVVFPFGYGLSYTDFEWTAGEVSIPDGSDITSADTISVTVNVTNNGSRPGKDVIQLYYTPPYYEGGIEKPHVTLGAFIKTDVIQPGETLPYTLELNVRDMASYDCYGLNNTDPSYRGYILEEGAYGISIRHNSHESSGIEYTYNVESAEKLETDSATGNKVTNLFDESNEEMMQDYVTQLSRSDWGGADPDNPDYSTGTWPTSGVTKKTAKPYSFLSNLGYVKDDSPEQPWYSETTPEYASRALTAEETTVKLYQLRELEYDDGGEGERLWNELLDQISLQEMSQLIGTGGFSTMQLVGVDKPKTTDADGPSGFVIFMEQSPRKTIYDTCFYASETLLGASFNTELAYRMGRTVGNESLVGNERGEGQRPYSGWYAPAANIHRSPFSGRNWEYYSEDPLLSGKMAANVITGAAEKGTYCYMKHFAVNDQETSREGVLTWANEQAMREIYFRPFEIAVKEGGATAMMSSFNRIGTTWAGGDYRLLTQLLREEWGFRGMVITDFNTNATYMPADQMIRAGGDLNLCQDIQPSADYTATQVTQMRRATRNILYTVSRSNAMNGFGADTVWAYKLPIWQIVLICIDCAAVAALAVWGVFAVRKAFRKQCAEKPDAASDDGGQNE